MILFVIIVVLSDILGFVKEHWLSIAFVLSEVLAFIPARYNGIAQALIKFIGSIITTGAGNSLPK